MVFSAPKITFLGKYMISTYYADTIEESRIIACKNLRFGDKRCIYKITAIDSDNHFVKELVETVVADRNGSGTVRYYTVIEKKDGVKRSFDANTGKLNGWRDM